MDDEPVRCLRPILSCVRPRKFHLLRRAPTHGTTVGPSVVMSARRFHSIRRTASNVENWRECQLSRAISTD